MLRTVVLHLAALSLVLAASCGPSLRHVQARSVTEAELLKSEVESKNIQDANIATADAKLANAKVDESMEAIYQADLAAAHYRAALANQSLLASRQALKDAEVALAVSEDQVKKYQEILKQISAGKEQ